MLVLKIIFSVDFRAQVLVSDILPRVQSRFKNQQHPQSFLDLFNFTASDVNRVLGEVEKIVPWIKCVNFPAFVESGKIDTKLLSRDGLHLSFRGTSYVSSVIRNSVRKSLGSQATLSKEQPTGQNPPISELQSENRETTSHPTTEVRQTTGQPTTDVRKTTSQPTTDVRTETTSQPTTDVRKTTSQPSTNVRRTTSQPTTNVRKTATHPTTNKRKTTSQPTTNVRKETTSQPTTNVKKTTGQPTTNVKKTTSHPTTNKRKRTSQPTTNVRKETTSQPTTNVKKTTSQPSTNVKKTTSQPTTNVKKPSQPSTNVKKTTSQPSTNVKKTTSQPSTNVKKTTSQPTTKVRKETTSQPTTNVKKETTSHSTTDVKKETIPDSRQVGGGNPDVTLNQGDTFKSYDEFKNKFDTWCAVNGYPMKVGGSEKLANSKHPYKSVKFQCKHYGKPRIRSNAQRPVQQYLASGCTAIVRIHLDSSEEIYKVTKLSTEHNHEISPQNLPMYSKNRTLSVDEIEEIKPFIEMKVDTKNIRQYVSSKFGKTVINKDINNVKQKLTTEKVNGRTQGKILEDVLDELTEKDSNATTYIEVDENQDLDLLFIQTSEMKEMFEKSPNMIFMDNTYNVNMEGYSLNVILVDDENGNGKPVAYTYMRRETKENLTRIMEIFAEYNDISKINVVMIDKDLTEISVLKEKLPNAHIQLCSFHVIKYFKTKVSKIDNIKGNEKRDLLQLLRSILYSDTEEHYSERHERLLNEFSFFAQYYNDNWHSCRHMWVRCFQKDILNYGNFTNNKIESHNEKIKQYLSSKMHIPESVEHLIRAINDTYARSTYNNFLNLKTRIDTSSNDDVRNRYASLCVPSAFEIIRSELIKVCSIQHEVRDGENSVTIVSAPDAKEYHVSDNLTSCSCTINCNYGVPCRHIFVGRKEAGVDLYEESLVDQKWKRCKVSSGTVSTQSVAPNSPNVVQRKKKETGKDRLTPIEKYLKASEFFKEMASFMSTCGEKEFYSKLDQLKDLKDRWMKNEEVSMISEELLQTVNDLQTDENISDEVFCQTDISMDDAGEQCSIEKAEEDKSMPTVEEATENRAESSEDVSSVNDPFDNKDLPRVNIPIVKTRIGRPKGSTKPFWQISRSRRSLSLKDVKRKQEINRKRKKKDTNTGNKKQHSEEQKEAGQESDNSNIKIIVIEPDDTCDSAVNELNEDWIRNDNVCLSYDSKLSIESGEMLDDRVILAAQNILKSQFPEIHGLQPSVLSQGDITFETCPNNMVQILFKGGNKCGHWLTISTLNLKPGYVNVYDSLNLELDIDVTKQICTILRQESMYVTANKVPIQQQHGNEDCGLFAIATAVALCHGYEPNKIMFRQDRLRSHLVNCLEDGEFTMFPFDVNIRQKRIKSQKIRVYCKCRRPRDASSMIKCHNCSEWYHSQCVEDRIASPDSPFLCSEFCSNEYEMKNKS